MPQDIFDYDSKYVLMTGNEGFKNTPFLIIMQILYLFGEGSSFLFKVTISQDSHELHSKQNSFFFQGLTLNNTPLTKKSNRLGPHIGARGKTIHLHSFIGFFSILL